MIDQAAINFLVKLSLACLLLSLAIFQSVDCRAIQNEERQYTASDIQPVGSPLGSDQIYQYQHDPQPQPQEYSQSQGQAAQQNFQYYDQQPQQQQQPLQQFQQQQYQAYDNQIPSGAKPRPNKTHRRSILSSIMAPFTAMREQSVAMLSASLQGCQPNTFSLWCRFWSMFIRRR